MQAFRELRYCTRCAAHVASKPAPGGAVCLHCEQRVLLFCLEDELEFLRAMDGGDGEELDIAEAVD